MTLILMTLILMTLIIMTLILMTIILMTLIPNPKYSYPNTTATFDKYYIFFIK